MSESKNPSSKRIYDLGKNKIGFYSEITDESASEFIELMYEKSKEVKKLYIFIRSPGGCLYSALAIFDHLTRLRKTHKIITIAEGHIASGGTIIFCAGTKRLAMRNASFLFHQLSTEFSGKFAELVYQRKECKMLMKQICKIYKSHSTMDMSNIKKLLSKELVLSAIKCKANGFVTGWFD